MRQDQQRILDVVDKLYQDVPDATMMSVFEALDINPVTFARAHVEALQQVLASAIEDPSLVEAGNKLTSFLTMGIALGYSYALKKIGDEMLSSGVKPI